MGNCTVRNLQGKKNTQVSERYCTWVTEWPLKYESRELFDISKMP
jgi:hypothetical protein